MEPHLADSRSRCPWCARVASLTTRLPGWKANLYRLSKGMPSPLAFSFRSALAREFLRRRSFSRRPRRRPGMLRLIDRQLAASRQGHTNQRPPPQFLDRRTRNAFAAQRTLQTSDVIAQQIELAAIIVVRRMDGHFRWRQAEDQPATTGVDLGQREVLLQKFPVRVGIPAVQDGVCTRDRHLEPPGEQFDCCTFG